jgi:hypothetical protein
MTLSLGLSILFFMVGELLTGLIAIAVAIGVGFAPIWYILKGERNAIQGIQTQIKKDMQDMRNELHATNSGLNEIVLSGIDEKITVG